MSEIQTASKAEVSSTAIATKTGLGALMGVMGSAALAISISGAIIHKQNEVIGEQREVIKVQKVLITPCSVENVLKIDAARDWVSANIPAITAEIASRCTDAEGCPTNLVNSSAFHQNLAKQARTFQSMCPGTNPEDTDETKKLAYVLLPSKIDPDSSNFIFFTPLGFASMGSHENGPQICILAGTQVHELLHLVSNSRHNTKKEGEDWIYTMGGAAEILCLEQKLQSLEK